jgi:cytochrome c biogenesis protein CcdA
MPGAALKSMFRRPLQFLGGMAILVVAGVLGWLILSKVYDLARTLPKEVAGPLILAFGAIIGSVVTYILQRRGATEAKLREERAEMYGDFMKFFFDEVFASARTGAQVEPLKLHNSSTASLNERSCVAQISSFASGLLSARASSAKINRALCRVMNSCLPLKKYC